jgi:hypothetical protein
LNKNAGNRGSRTWEQLDPALAEALRPALDPLVDDVIAVVETTVPAYRGVLERNVRPGVRQALEGFLELVVAGEEAQLPERDVYVAFGRGEYREGRTLDALLSAYRAGAQVAWRGLAAAGDAAGLEPRSLYKLAEAIFAYIDEISAASAEGFALEQSRAAGEEQERRRRVVELLLREPQAPPTAIEAAAREAGWTLPPQLAVLAFEDERPDRAAARLPGDALTARLDGIDWAIVPDPDGPGRRAQLERAVEGTRAVLGPTVVPAQAPRSARRARIGMRVSGLGGRGLVIADEHLLELMLEADEELSRDLAQKRLAPLDDLAPNARERLLETLEAWLDAHGEARPAAERLHVHVQTVRYRLGQLRELLGEEALDDPEARLELALALRVRRSQPSA